MQMDYNLNICMTNVLLHLELAEFKLSEKLKIHKRMMDGNNTFRQTERKKHIGTDERNDCDSQIET